VKEEIAKMEKPSIKLAEEVSFTLCRMAEQSLKKNRFDRLDKVISSAVKRVLDLQLKVTKNAIKEHLEIEQGMIFSSDDKFQKLLKVNY
jgi:NMD protein affecting ribosome stability and mRNA decay